MGAHDVTVNLFHHLCILSRRKRQIVQATKLLAWAGQQEWPLSKQAKAAEDLG